MQHTIQDNTHDADLLNAVASFLRRLHIMYQAYRFGRAARKALNNREVDIAEIAMRKFDELNKMI